MNFPRIFFTNLYREYDQSLRDFRKRILKTFQISTTLIAIVYMIAVFPFYPVPTTYYIALPSYIVLNNGISFLLKKKRFERFCPFYLMVLQLIGQVISIEIGVASTKDSSNKFKSFFIGAYIGLTQIVSFLNFSSSWHKLIISLFLVAQVLIKQIQLDFESISTRIPLLFGTLLFVNWVFFRTEVLSFQIWSSWRQRNESLQHFQTLFANFPSQIVVINKASLELNQSTYCNREAELLCARAALDTKKASLDFLQLFRIGKRKKDCPNEEGMSSTKYLNIETLKEKVVELFEEKHAEKKEFKTFFCDKGESEWEVKVGWIEWNQKEAVILIFNDLSIANKIKELQIIDENKNKTLAKVSHELRTPINGMLGMIEAMRSKIAEGKFGEVLHYLNIVESSAKTLLFMINDILDFEQMRNGKLRLNIERKSVTEVIERVLPLIEVQIKNKGVELIYQNECPEAARVIADSARLQQILWNLLWNACKFTSRGYVKLLTRLQLFNARKEKRLRDSKPEECEELINCSSDIGKEVVIEFSVEDTGRGIQEHRLAELFKDFGKLENNGNPTGIGLGLAISQSLAKQMSSSGIQVSSEYGKGSRFFFSLRAEIREEQPGVPDETPLRKSIATNSFSGKPAHSKPKAQKRFNVLIVDDDMVNHLLYDQYFQALGKPCSKEKAFNGEDALKLVLDRASKATYFDLILTDCNMPIMDGSTLTIAVKELVEASTIPRVKVIGITADHSPHERNRCLEIGMLDVWTKPLSKSDFLNRINKLLC